MKNKIILALIILGVLGGMAYAFSATSLLQGSFPSDTVPPPVAAILTITSTGGDNTTEIDWRNDEDLEYTLGKWTVTSTKDISLNTVYAFIGSPTGNSDTMDYIETYFGANYLYITDGNGTKTSYSITLPDKTSTFNILKGSPYTFELKGKPRGWDYGVLFSNGGMDTANYTSGGGLNEKEVGISIRQFTIMEAGDADVGKAYALKTDWDYFDYDTDYNYDTDHRYSYSPGAYKLISAGHVSESAGGTEGGTETTPITGTATVTPYSEPSVTIKNLDQSLFKIVSQTDNSVVTAVSFSESEGVYTFELPYGDYKITVSAVGFVEASTYISVGDVADNGQTMQKYAYNVIIYDGAENYISGASVTAGDDFGVTCIPISARQAYGCPVPFEHTGTAFKIVASGYAPYEGDFSSNMNELDPVRSYAGDPPLYSQAVLTAVASDTSEPTPTESTEPEPETSAPEATSPATDATEDSWHLQFELKDSFGRVISGLTDEYFAVINSETGNNDVESITETSDGKYIVLTDQNASADYYVYVDGFVMNESKTYASKNEMGDYEAAILNYSNYVTLKDEAGNLLSGASIVAGDDYNAACIDASTFIANTAKKGQYGCIISVDDGSTVFKVSLDGYEEYTGSFAQDRTSESDDSQSASATLKKIVNHGTVVESPNRDPNFDNNTPSGNGAPPSNNQNKPSDKTEKEMLKQKRAEVLASASYKCEDPFTDTKGHWAQDMICRLYNVGIVSGRSYNTFKPNEQITRAEFLKMALLNAGYELENAANYTEDYKDVNSNDWFYPYVVIAERIGVLRNQGGNFNPNSYITRGDAVVLSVRIAKQTLYGFTQRDIPFSDVFTSDYFAYAVIIATNTRSEVPNKGDVAIVEGYSDRTFRPKNNITRAEVAAITLRAYIAWYK